MLSNFNLTPESSDWTAFMLSTSPSGAQFRDWVAFMLSFSHTRSSSQPTAGSNECDFSHPFGGIEMTRPNECVFSHSFAGIEATRGQVHICV